MKSMEFVMYRKLRIRAIIRIVLLKQQASFAELAVWASSAKEVGHSFILFDYAVVRPRAGEVRILAADHQSHAPIEVDIFRRNV